MSKGWKKWTEEEVALLLSLPETMTMKQMAEAIGRPYPSARKKMDALHVRSHTRAYRPWTRSEDEQLHAMLGKYTTQQMAEVLGRSVSSVKGHLKDRWKAKPAVLPADSSAEPPEALAEDVQRVRAHGWMRRLAASFAGICTEEECRQVYRALAGAYQWGCEAR